MAQRRATPIPHDDGGLTEWEDDDAFDGHAFDGHATIPDETHDRPLQNCAVLKDTASRHATTPRNSRNRRKSDAKRGDVRRKKNNNPPRKQTEPSQHLYDFLWSTKAAYETFDAETLWGQTSTTASASDLVSGLGAHGKPPSASRNAHLQQAAEALQFLGNNSVVMHDDSATIDSHEQEDVLSYSSSDEQLLLDLIEDARRNAMENKRYIRLSERRKEAFETILRDMLTCVGVSSVTSWKEYFILKAELCLLFKNYRLMFLSSIAAQLWNALPGSKEESAANALLFPNATQKHQRNNAYALPPADRDDDAISVSAQSPITRLSDRAITSSPLYVPGGAKYGHAPLDGRSISNMATQFISAYQLGYRSLAMKLKTELLSIPYELVQSSLPSFVLKTLEGTMDALDLIPALLGALEQHARAVPPRQQHRVRRKAPTARQEGCNLDGFL